ncbi:MAG: hypothetical protein HOH73_05110 [Alphaproteobacteria bacterium]|jgi:hypothetical protein|nr:hypothetical protein [Alphaproteobacteria bacterium]
MTRENPIVIPAVIPAYASLTGVLLSFARDKLPKVFDLDKKLTTDRKNNILFQLGYNKEHECLALYQVSKAKFKQNIEFEIFQAFTVVNEQDFFLQLVRPSYAKRHILLDARYLKALSEKQIISFVKGNNIDLLSDLSSQEQKKEDIIWSAQTNGAENLLDKEETKNPGALPLEVGQESSISLNKTNSSLPNFVA